MSRWYPVNRVVDTIFASLVMQWLVTRWTGRQRQPGCVCACAVEIAVYCDGGLRTKEVCYFKWLILIYLNYLNINLIILIFLSNTGCGNVRLWLYWIQWQTWQYSIRQPRPHEVTWVPALRRSKALRLRTFAIAGNEIFTGNRVHAILGPYEKRWPRFWLSCAQTLFSTGKIWESLSGAQLR